MTWNKEFCRLTAQLEHATETFYKARAMQTKTEKLLRRNLRAFKKHFADQPPNASLDPQKREIIDEHLLIWQRLVS